MKQQQLHRDYPLRRWLVLGLFAAGVLLLIGRAVDLQLKHKEFLKNHGDARALRVVDIPANRGMITDRHGEPLAMSISVDSIWAVPRQLLDAPCFDELAELLGYAGRDLRQTLTDRLDREFVYLRRHADPQTVAKMRELGIAGVYTQREYRRYYPAGEVTAHLIGFTNVDDIGQEGMELAYNDWLQGTPGAKRVLKDRLGRTVENVESIRAPDPGEPLVLSIDRRLQYLAYLELKAVVTHYQARSGTIVLLDVDTGEVLAMASQPSYNPNNRTGLQSDALRNRAMTDVFEPGSTIKPFTIAAALESGLYEADETLDTAPGYYRVGGHTIRDHRDYGVLDLTGIIRKSSNVGASKIALSLESDRLWSMFDRLGLGRITGTGFPGEAGGRLSTPGGWSDVELATAAFGYGLSVTAVQLAQAYATLGAGGVQRPVSLLRQDAGVNGGRVMPAAVARQVVGMLEGVVTADGTGSRAAIKGYRVAGKTGTVHKATAGGYATDRYLSVFAGLAPASRPRLALVVMINEPQGEYYGGIVAAPVFSRVMADALRLLNLPPDDLPALNPRLVAQRPDDDAAGGVGPMMAAETLQPGMPLSQLLAGRASVPINADVHVSGVALDSRCVKPGDVFLACRGSREDGRAFIADALHHGAVAVVVDEEVPEALARQNVPAVAVTGLAQRAGEIAARFYGDPSAGMKVAGITGTNGKTSIASYCAQALAALDTACGLFGTLGYGRYGELQPATTTTPDPITLQRMLAELHADGVGHVVMEVSSHALEQGRVNGTVFDIAVFTNLSRDHLDYHAGMDAYAAAKRRLFDWPGLQSGLVNIDDAFGRELLKTGDKRLLGYSTRSPAADLHAVIADRSRTGMCLDVKTPWGQGSITVSLTGSFNAMNVLATVGVLCLLDVPFASALKSLESIHSAPGRMQLLGGNGQPLVVVDYAHTPDALAQVLDSLRADCCGKLWCVFGCGGERDIGKRPLMAAAAEKYADRIVITSDNPRAEDPARIIETIRAGLSQTESAQVEPDRARAIAGAISQADSDDTILIAGKGHETYQEIAGERYPFSDSQVAQTCLRDRR